MVFQLVSLLMEPQNREVGKKLLYYTVAMFTIPVAVFYACNAHVFPESRNRPMWSGFAAVASVNVIIAAYVVSAFKEDKEEPNRGPAPRVGIYASTDKRTD